MQTQFAPCKNGKFAVLKLSGRFDSFETAPVIKMLAEFPPQVVVDLGQVTFIDSMALAVLVQGMKHCREQNGDLYLCNLSQPVRIIFELTCLDKAFAIFPTQAEAEAAFAI